VSGSPWSSDGGAGRREASSEGRRGGEENEWEARVGGLAVDRGCSLQNCPGSRVDFRVHKGLFCEVLTGLWPAASRVAGRRRRQKGTGQVSNPEKANAVVLPKWSSL
jgi:hypothetical protein